MKIDDVVVASIAGQIEPAYSIEGERHAGAAGVAAGILGCNQRLSNFPGIIGESLLPHSGLFTRFEALGFAVDNGIDPRIEKIDFDGRCSIPPLVEKIKQLITAERRALDTCNVRSRGVTS